MSEVDPHMAAVSRVQPGCITVCVCDYFVSGSVKQISQLGRIDAFEIVRWGMQHAAVTSFKQ